MIRAVPAVLVAAAIVGALTACDVPQPPAPATAPFGVQSACDEHGHRVYGYHQAGPAAGDGAFAVVEDDWCETGLRTAGGRQ